VKKIEAVINESKIQEIRALLARVGVDGMTVSDVRGYGRARGQTELYRSSEHERPYVPRLKIEIVVEDGRAPALVEELVKVTWSGRVGDGKIFVLPVDDAVRIRTSERGPDAI
jgi:nitrogen regulatory protein P-II 1